MAGRWIALLGWGSTATVLLDFVAFLVAVGRGIARLGSPEKWFDAKLPYVVFGLPILGILFAVSAMLLQRIHSRCHRELYEPSLQVMVGLFGNLTALCCLIALRVGG